VGSECSLIGRQLAADVHSQPRGIPGFRNGLSNFYHGLRLPHLSESVPRLTPTRDVPVAYAEPYTQSIDPRFFAHACQAICCTAPDNRNTQSVIGWAANPVESAGYEAQLELFTAGDYPYQELAVQSGSFPEFGL